MASLEIIALVLTGLSISASIIYYSNILSNANKAQKIQLEKRELDQFLTLYQQLRTYESWERYVEIVYNIQCKDFNEFIENYGPNSNPKVYANICSLWYDFTIIGDLTFNGTFSLQQVFWLVADMPVRTWDKWGAIIQELRDHLGSPDAYLAFDYLASELRKHIDSESHKNTLNQMRKPLTYR